MIRDTDTIAMPGKPHAVPATAAGALVYDPFAGSRYRVTGRLGRGGSADVYEAEHLALGTTVVLKVLKVDLANDPMYLDRMRLEAQTLARLRHRNLIAVTDAGCTADGRPFFVMERLAGQTLLAEIRARGWVPASEAVALVQQILAGLSAAHEVGIIHRDLKLENIFLCDPDDEGQRTLKILDFGIAKVLPGADIVRAPKPLALKSHEGMPLGTPRFLSPEQVLCREVTVQTDIYGTGTVLYELLTGRDPFFDVEGYLELLDAHVSTAPTPPSAVAQQPIDPGLDAIVLRALAKTPELRFESAQAFSDALAATLERCRASTHPPPLAVAPQAHGSLAVGLFVVLGSAILSALISFADRQGAMISAGAEGRARMNELGQEQAVAAGDILHQFKMVRTLGAGFHGEVWLAEHVHTGVPFAFKFMHLEDSKDAKKVRRALETAKGTYRIDHANVIKVHDLGCEPSGMVWLRMDYLEGKSVAELLRQGALSLLVALDIAIEVAWGLAAAHELGIIHRDIKPDNVFMTRDGVIVVLDFSIAKVISAGIRTTVRKTGMGTAPYMAPEHLGGAHPDARFDIYALGIMLWELITGHHHYHDVLRDTEALIRRALHVNPAPLSIVAQLPAEVDEIIRRATAKDPAARYGTVVEMAQAMARLKAWLLAEIGAQRLVLTKRRGEPTVNSPRGRKDYQRDAAPDATPAPPLPSQRVVVLAPASLPKTLPLPEVVGPGGTLAFGANILQVAEQQLATAGVGLRDTVVLGVGPSAPTFGTRPTSTEEGPGEAERVGSVAPRLRTAPPWVPITLLATVLGIVTAGVVLGSIVRRPSPVAFTSASAGPTSTPSVPRPPDSAPEAQPSVAPEPPRAPDLSAPSSSAGPRTVPAPPKPPSSRPPASTPAPKFTPMFEFAK